MAILIDKKRKPKKPCLWLVASLFISAPVFAQTVSQDLTGLGMPAEQADYLAGILPAGSVLGNNTYLKGRNQANSADIDMIKITTSDDTQINSSASDLLIFQLSDDAQRLVNWVGASDTVLGMTYGDGGTTAAQTFTFAAATGDGDDDSQINIAGGGTATTSRGAYLSLAGAEAAAHATLGSADTAGADVILAAKDDILFTTEAGATVWTADVSGTFIGAGTSTIGWTVVDGTDNTACSAQCTAPAVFGFDLAAGATAPVIVSPGTATADICLCAGAS